MIEEGFEFCEPYLGLYEYIIWSGKPKAQKFNFASIIGIVMALVFLAIGITLLYFSIKAMLIPAIIFTVIWTAGVIFTLVNILTNGRIYTKTSAYVITNKKIMRSRGFAVDTVDITERPRMKLTVNKDGSGSIYILERSYYGQKREKFNFSANENIVLSNIPDVENVYQKILDLYK